MKMKQCRIVGMCLLGLVMVLSLGVMGFDDSRAATKSKKYKFALVHGALHPYFDPMTQAARDAEKDFNLPETTITAPQKWDQPEQNVIFDGLVAKGYTGIATMMSEPSAGNVQIGKMVDHGVFVIVYAGPPATPSKAPFYLATDSAASAYLATKTVIEQMGGKGNLVHLAGMVVEANVKLRMEAVEKCAAEYPDVTLIQTLADLDVVEAAEDRIGSLLAARRSSIDGIVSTSYIPTMVLATKLTDLKETRIKAVGNDTDPKVLEAIQLGHMYATTSQNPYGQAYLSLYSLKLFVDGYTWKEDNPFHIDSGTFLITKDNVDTVDKVLEESTQQLLTNWKEKYFNPPAE